MAGDSDPKISDNPFAKAEPHRPDYEVPGWEPLTSLTCASFVDNFVAVGSSAKNATAIAEAFEAELLKTWKQKIKPESREIIVVKGGGLAGTNLSRWKPTKDFRILGITIQDNGETDHT